MTPYNPRERQANGVAPPVGPHPSFIQIARPYVFEQELQACMAATGVTEAKEDTIRLQGVTWIDSVRQALQLPVRTYNTAVVYYHKFRLVHPDNEYDYRDAAAAALFNACKIEDTLKKSRDILCAAYNLKLPASDHKSSDDPLFESHSRTIVGLERLMLEASGFDFRNRYPQKMLMKLVKSCNLDRDTVGITAYKICLDLYRTFAPLKQTTQAMALACLELAIRLCDIDLATVVTEHGFDYDKWATTREEIMETLIDLLDVYTHHRLATLVGPEHTIDTFISIRITLNQEASSNEYPRYTQWKDPPPTATPGSTDSRKHTNGFAPRAVNGAMRTPSSISPQSPSRGSVGERGKDGTVRFMLDPARAKEEKSIVKEYFEPPKEVEDALVLAHGYRADEHGMEKEIEIEDPVVDLPEDLIEDTTRPILPTDSSVNNYRLPSYMPKVNPSYEKACLEAKMQQLNKEIKYFHQIAAEKQLHQVEAEKNQPDQRQETTVEIPKARLGYARVIHDEGEEYNGSLYSAIEEHPRRTDVEHSPPLNTVQPLAKISPTVSPDFHSSPPQVNTRVDKHPPSPPAAATPTLTNRQERRKQSKLESEANNPNLIPVDPRRIKRRFGAEAEARAYSPPPQPKDKEAGSAALKPPSPRTHRDVDLEQRKLLLATSPGSPPPPPRASGAPDRHWAERNVEPRSRGHHRPADERRHDREPSEEGESRESTTQLKADRKRTRGRGRMQRRRKPTADSSSHQRQMDY